MPAATVGLLHFQVCRVVVWVAALCMHAFSWAKVVGSDRQPIWLLPRRQNKGSSEALNRNALLYVLAINERLPNKRDALEMEMRTVSYQTAVGSALLPSSLWRWILKSMPFQLPRLPKGLLSTLFDRRQLTSQPKQRLITKPCLEQLPV